MQNVRKSITYKGLLEYMWHNLNTNLVAERSQKVSNKRTLRDVGRVATSTLLWHGLAMATCTDIRGATVSKLCCPLPKRDPLWMCSRFLGEIRKQWRNTDEKKMSYLERGPRSVHLTHLPFNTYMWGLWPRKIDLSPHPDVPRRCFFCGLLFLSLCVFACMSWYFILIWIAVWPTVWERNRPFAFLFIVF